MINFCLKEILIIIYKIKRTIWRIKYILINKLKRKSLYDKQYIDI